MKAVKIIVSGALLGWCLASLPAWAAKVEITFAKRYEGHGSIEGGKGYIETVIEEFERQNPDIKVNFQPLTDNWVEKLTAQMATGTAPDVFEMWGDFAYNWGEKGMLLDLNPLVKRDFNADYIKGFYPGQWDAAVILDGPRAGVRYGIPRYTNSVVIFYNQELFEKAGLPTPHEMEQQKNWTWTTFLDAAKKLTQRQGNQFTTIGYQEYQGPYQWVWSNGGKVFDYPQNPTRFLLDQPAAVEALRFVRSLAFDVGVSAPNRWAVNGWFQQGRMAMTTFWGSCCIRGMGSEIKGAFKWNIAPLPVAPTGRRVSMVFLDMWGIYSQTKHPEAAWKFVKFLLSPFAMGVAARMFGEQPAHISGVRQYIEAFRDVNVQYAVEMAVTANVHPSSVVPHSADVMRLLNGAIDQSVYGNQKPVETALAEVRPAIAGIFAGR